MVRTASEVETNIVAVERVEEYANVQQEVRVWLIVTLYVTKHYGHVCNLCVAF